jgi:hypothetical protein
MERFIWNASILQDLFTSRSLDQRAARVLFDPTGIRLAQNVMSCGDILRWAHQRGIKTKCFGEVANQL